MRKCIILLIVHPTYVILAHSKYDTIIIRREKYWGYFYGTDRYYWRSTSLSLSRESIIETSIFLENERGENIR